MKTPILESLFLRHSIAWEYREGAGPTWDGTNLDVSSAVDSAWEAHEIAHCLIASRLDLPNYGMGTDPGGGGYSERTLTNEECESEEEMALLGGVLLLIQEGSSDAAIFNHVREYGIENFTSEEAALVYERLPQILKNAAPLEVLTGHLEWASMKQREAREWRASLN